MTSSDVSESRRKRNTIICEKSSHTTDLTDSPARLCENDEKTQKIRELRKEGGMEEALRGGEKATGSL